MTSKTNVIPTILHVLLWIVFIGLCIQTGVNMFSYMLTMWAHYMNVPSDHWAIVNMNSGYELKNVYQYGIEHFIILGSLLLLLTGIKAHIAYYFILISSQLKLEKPFTEVTYKLLGNISQIALGAGILAVFAGGYSEWLAEKEVPVAVEWNYQEFLFFSAVMYVIAQVFKKGAEFQSESELTI